MRIGKSLLKYSMILTGVLFLFVTATSGSAGDYDLGLNTLSPSDVNSTNATFRTNFTSMNNSLDAATIYWNYTDKSGGDVNVGPLNVSGESGKIINLSQSDLDSDITYEVTSYANPVEWENYSKVRNLLDLTNYSSSSDTIYNNIKILSNLKSTSEAVTALFGSEAAMRSIMDNESSKTELWSSTGDGAVTYRSEDIFLDPQNYVEYAGVETNNLINFTDVTEVDVNFSAVINNNNDANVGDDYVSLYLNNTEMKVWGDNTLSNLPTGIRTVDTSSITGFRTLEFRAVRTSNGAGYETHDIEAQLYDIYLNSSERPYYRPKTVSGGTVELPSRESPIICDIYSPDLGCVSNSKHVINGENILLSRRFNATIDSVIEAKSSPAKLEINNVSIISGIWKGNIDIKAEDSRIVAGAKFRPGEGQIRIGN